MSEVEKFATALIEVKEKIVFCSTCNNLTDVNPCLYCANPKRDRSIICIIEEPYNLVAVEKTRSYKGFITCCTEVVADAGCRAGRIDACKFASAITPENNDGVEIAEIIVATNPTTEGEATANYIARLLKPLGLCHSNCDGNAGRL